MLKKMNTLGHRWKGEIDMGTMDEREWVVRS